MEASRKDDTGPATKKQKGLFLSLKSLTSVVKIDQVELDQLPSSDKYEKSYMHRDSVTHITASSDFIFTASSDGHVKFWKKLPEGIEFVKQFRAHSSPVLSLAVSRDGSVLSSGGKDGLVHVFHTATFDLARTHQLSRPLRALEIFTDSGAVWLVLAHPRQVVLMEGFDGTVRREWSAAGVTVLQWNSPLRCLLSADLKGGLDFWAPLEDLPPPPVPGEPPTPPSTTPPPLPQAVTWRFKSETALYSLAEKKAVALSVAFSGTGESMGVYGSDRQLRVFHVRKGTLRLQVDYGLARFPDLFHPPDLGRRLAFERSLDSLLARQLQAEALLSYGPPPTDPTAGPSKDPTESESGEREGKETEEEEKEVPVRVRLSGAVQWGGGEVLLVSGGGGVTALHVPSRRIVRRWGVGEALRWGSVRWYHSLPSPSPDSLPALPKEDPLLLAMAWDLSGKPTSRFYYFSHRPPLEGADAPPRDVINERPQLSSPSHAAAKNKRLGRAAVLHTTRGDIHLQLFPEQCPKTVENFSVHAKMGYYNGCLFHRVIKGFMIQTGDPTGDGTGGTSIWGHEFGDEFHPSLRHSQAGALSMANAGPNTNGSQFFITCVPTPSLDNKHTVFGQVTKGMEVVHDIEKVPTDKSDKPLDDIKIVNIHINFGDK